MANAPYMPLLLAGTNAALVADDSHLETQARGQVDYLSHEWDEDDIARSWRNMTRQKNDIANGMRLENASWRTWWKQRNKLKTISPETLNWLKDSDVTWLYGPLHTAVDWTPPPKPKEDPTSVDDRAPSSAQDRLDLAHVVHKPILKHRTISEQLTSDLPSGVVSPRIPEHLDGVQEALQEEEDGLSRPPIVYAKSDSNVVPSTQTSRNMKAIAINEDFRRGSPINLPIDTPSPQAISRTESGASSSHSASPSPGPEGPRKRKPARHITFNTYVEQCISIDKPLGQPMRHSSSNINLRREADFSMPMRSSSQPSLHVQPPPQPHKWDGRTSGVRWAGNVDDEHDDSSPSSSSDEAPQFVAQAQPPFAHEDKKRNHQSSGKHSIVASSDDDDYEDVWEETTTESSPSTTQDEDDDDDDVLEMRPRKGSSSSARLENSDALGPDPQRRPDLASLMGDSKQRRRSSNNTVSGGSFGSARSPSIVNLDSLPNTPRPEQPQQQEHITIAPIAPTTLKTDWDSFGVGIVPNGKAGIWQDGFGEEDDDFAMPPPTSITSTGLHAKAEGGELVYVPKYSAGFRADPTDNHLITEEPETQVWHHEEAYFSTADADKAASDDGKEQEKKEQEKSVPVVVRTPPAPEAQAKDAYDYFEGPDFGEDFDAPVGKPDGRKSYSSRTAENNSNERQSRRTTSTTDDEPRGRSRSRSRSRTPSPLNSPPTVFAGQQSKRLSPPTSRTGRPPTSPVVSTSSPTSPSSSPTGMRAGGAHVGRSDSQPAATTTTREQEGGRERGRPRVERQLSHSLSPPGRKTVGGPVKVEKVKASEIPSSQPQPTVGVKVEKVKASDIPPSQSAVGVKVEKVKANDVTPPKTPSVIKTNYIPPTSSYIAPKSAPSAAQPTSPRSPSSSSPPSSSSYAASSSYIPPAPPSAAITMREADDWRSRNPTPASSPTAGMAMGGIAQKLDEAAAARREGSGSGWERRAEGDEPQSPSSPTGAMFNKAAGMMNSAGAYFGLWKGGRAA